MPAVSQPLPEFVYHRLPVIADQDPALPLGEFQQVGIAAPPQSMSLYVADVYGGLAQAQTLRAVAE